MKYKLAIFDMDGTILDTLLDLTSSINYALSVNNYPTHSIDAVRSFVGNGLGVLVDKACPESSTEEEKAKIFASFKAHYKVHSADNTRPYEGICDLLKSLKQKGCITAVVSNKPHFAVLDLCNKYFNDLFDIALGEKPDIPRKPNPDPVYYILDKLKIEKKDAVYIGDSDVDYKTSINSGLDYIIVTWGFRDEKMLRDLGATVFAHTPKDIEKIILN